MGVNGYTGVNWSTTTKMFMYELWVGVVGHEMLWSRVACKSNNF